jgi:cysteinyl-tRNA synthetase
MWQARRAHDFMTADQIREQLRGRGVSIDDRTKVRMGDHRDGIILLGPCARDGEGHGGGGGGGDGHTSVCRGMQMWSCSDGRKGMIGASKPVTQGIEEGDLQRLLKEREEARRQKDFVTADRVRGYH